MSKTKLDKIDFSALKVLDTPAIEGSTAKIMKACLNNQVVAIKSLKAPIACKLKAFNNERTIISHFEDQHPNIVNIFGYTDIPSSAQPALVMEYAENNDLIDYLSVKASKVSGWKHTAKPLQIAKDIAQGLMYLHKLGIIHRDIKPENILIDAAETGKITDFGTSYKLQHSDINGVRRDYASIGTIIYLAPESTTSFLTNNLTQSEYSKASDVYAFGLLILVLLLFRTPYFELADNDAVIEIKKGNTEKITDVPIHLHGLFKNIWNMDPEMRPSIEDEIDRLDKHL